MKKAIVVGSGAGGATIAKELQGKFDVTIVEEGKDFRPFRANLELIERLKKTHLLFDERMISLLFPAMKVRISNGGMVVVNGSGPGGTTTICTANGIRHDNDLKAIGINLDREFEELAEEVPISTDHMKLWHDHTQMVFDACDKMGLHPLPTPKMAYAGRCASCGRCVFGCVRGAKWDTRQFVIRAMEKGATLVTNAKVRRLVIESGQVIGVDASIGTQRKFYRADLVVLAAGGLGTPFILRNSGIECQQRLFVDPVICIAARWNGSGQNKEIPMPFIVQRDQFIISPYFDFVSFFFNRRWNIPSDDIYSLMIKLADSSCGDVRDGKIGKSLSSEDNRIVAEGVFLCKEIFKSLGIDSDRTFLGTVNAGHPGGMLPLTESEAKTLHHDILPANLYVADSTLFPESLGNPPILTIMAMAKRIGKICLSNADA